MTHILKRETRDTPQTAIETAKNISYHAQEDSKTAFRVVALDQWPIIAIGAVLTGVASQSLFPDQNVAETIKFAVTGGIAASCAYLTQTVLEVRQKLSYMRDTFKRAAQNFTNFETKMTHKLNYELNAPRMSFSEIIDFKKRPISNSLALLFEAAAICAPVDPISKMMLGYVGMNIALNGIVLDEERSSEALKKTAYKTRDHLEFMRNLRLRSPEKLDGWDFS